MRKAFIRDMPERVADPGGGDNAEKPAEHRFHFFKG
jgi:hypothetical protein